MCTHDLKHIGRLKFIEGLILFIHTCINIIPSSAKIPIISYFSNPDTGNEDVRKQAIYLV